MTRNILKEKYETLKKENNVTLDELNKLINYYKERYDYYKKNLKSSMYSKKEMDEFINTYNDIITDRRKIMSEYSDPVTADSVYDIILQHHFEYLNDILNLVGDEILDNDQRRVVVKNDTNLLVVAGAGSGKTTTMLAKIKFLIDKIGIKAEEILMVSYTNSTVDDLKLKLNEKMGINSEVCTFHKLGRNILELSGNKFEVVDENSDFPRYILSNVLEEEYFFDKDKIEKFMKLLGDKLFLEKGESREQFKNNCLEKNLETLMQEDLILEYIHAEFEDKQVFFNIDNYERCKRYLYIEKKNRLNKLFEEVKSIYDKSKASQISLSEINTDDFSDKDHMLLDIVKLFAREYEFHKAKYKKKDFDDLVIEANELINTDEKVCSQIKYKYIIIDEFQDISLIRFNLVKSLANLTNAKIVAVGDDWQSIFGFSGSDISLFYDFPKHFSNSATLKIETTYRNSQELVNVASDFIQKNPKQIKKQLKSNKEIENPIIAYEVDSEYNYENKFHSFCLTVEKCILDIIHRNGIDKINNIKIGLLYRYKFDLKAFNDSDIFTIDYVNNQLIYIKNKKINISLCSVHASKGLGFDEVILINIKDESSGFPAQKKNDGVLGTFLNKEEFEFAEERRLFYVACTRTKNRLYLIKPENPSCFYSDIKDYVLENPLQLDVNDFIFEEDITDLPLDTDKIVEFSTKDILPPWLADSEDKDTLPPWLADSEDSDTNWINDATESEVVDYIIQPTNENKVDFESLNDERVEDGKNGEEYVIEYERYRLESMKLHEYIEKIEHVALVDDSAGYDIKSFDLVGNEVVEIYIEVKATRFDCNKNFYITNNELEKSKEYKEKYRLYRVYNLYEENVSIKINEGSLEDLILFPIKYCANIE